MLDRQPKEILSLIANNLDNKSARKLSICCASIFKNKLSKDFFLSQSEEKVNAEIILFTANAIDEYLKNVKSHPGLDLEFTRTNQKRAQLKYDKDFHRAICFQDLLKEKILTSSFKLLLVHFLLNEEINKEEIEGEQLKLLVSNVLKTMLGEKVFEWIKKHAEVQVKDYAIFQDELIKTIHDPQNAHSATTLQGMQKHDPEVAFHTNQAHLHYQNYWLNKIVNLQIACQEYQEERNEKIETNMLNVLKKP